LEVSDGKNEITVIAGDYKGLKGPMEEITVQPTFMEVRLESNESFRFDSDSDSTLFIYILRGSTYFASDDMIVKEKSAILFESGLTLELNAGDSGAMFLLFSGKPLHEPIAWGGPIVMNTKEELARAFNDLDEGTFIKEHGADGSITGTKVHKNFYQSNS